MATKKGSGSEPVPDHKRGVYGITVAADMVGTGVQNLRLYERKGLLEPSRSSGGTRLYSPYDVERLARITNLLAEGLNLAGVAMVLDLQDDITRRKAKDKLEQQRSEKSTGRTRADHGVVPLEPIAATAPQATTPGSGNPTRKPG